MEPGETKFDVAILPEEEFGCHSISMALDGGLLLPRGRCSFFTKARTAARAGATYLIISDAEGSSDILSPTIAEGGVEFGGLLTLGVSAHAASLLRSSAANGSSSVTAVTEQSALRSCLSRASQLLQGGLSNAAAAALEACEDASLLFRVASNQSDAASSQLFAEASPTLPEGLVEISRKLTAAGLNGAALTWAGIAHNLDRSCAVCQMELSQALLRAGHVRGSLSHGKEAHLLLLKVSKSAGSAAAVPRGETGHPASLQLVLSSARLAALTFLIADDFLSTLRSVKAWTAATESLRSLPPDVRHRSLSLAAILSTGGDAEQGDKSLWLLFTLMDELSRLELDDTIEHQLASCYFNAGPHTAPNATVRACCDNISSGVSRLLSTLLDIHITLALFLDESGFFELADRCAATFACLSSRTPSNIVCWSSPQVSNQIGCLCRHIGIAVGMSCRLDVELGLRIRRATATPTVAASLESMIRDREKLASQVRSLEAVGQTRFSDPALAYTMTPSTMMIGYQGMDDPAMLRRIALLYNQHDSKLSGVTTRLVRSSTMTSSAAVIQSAKSVGGSPKRVRVGFLSSYLKTHSVGRLIAGVARNLDSKKIDCHIFLATHFLRAHISANSSGGEATFDDPLTESLAQAVGRKNVHVLPPPGEKEVSYYPQLLLHRCF